MTLRCCLGVDDTLAVVLWFSTKLLDADRLCTDDASLVLLHSHHIIIIIIIIIIIRQLIRRRNMSI